MTVVFTDSTGEPFGGDPGGWQSWPTDPRTHPRRHKESDGCRCITERTNWHTLGKQSVLFVEEKRRPRACQGLKSRGQRGEIEAGGKGLLCGGS